MPLANIGAAALTKQIPNKQTEAKVITIGQQYGHWRVLIADGRYVTCICRCGTVRIFNTDELKKMSSSCGCMRRE
jgi:hypothetical protein